MTEYVGAMTQAGRPLAGRTFVLPEHKVMYVSVAKNACTSMKWLIADLAGEDSRRFRRAASMSSTPADTIHQRDLWQHAAKFDGATPYDGSIDPADGWFVFGIVRNPFDRLFSGWQSKFLNHDPHYRRFSGEPFYPELPNSVEDVISSFATFVEFLDKNPDHKVASTDTHFAAQMALLQPWRVPFTKLYDVREVGTLLTDLGVHLDGLGIEHPVLQLARDNTTPLRSCRALFDNGVGDLVAKRYAKDLEFGDWSIEDLPSQPPDWSADVFRGMAATAGAYDRIHVLTNELRDARKHNRKLRRKVVGLEESRAAGMDPAPLNADGEGATPSASEPEEKGLAARFRDRISGDRSTQ